MTDKAPKSLDDFRRAHDPTYQLESVGTTFHREIDWGLRRRALIVSAQNATPVDPDWWPVINHMAETLDVELLVIPLRYKNPTSLWTASQRNSEWWAPEVKPYLWNAAEDLNPNCMVIGDTKIQPTDSNPLSGMDALSHASSCVIGHTRAQSKSVPTPQSKMAKFMMTSGACTVPNYTDTRVGQLARFHHALTAVLVELDGKRFYMRRLCFSSRTKRVIDNGIAYYADRHETAPPSLGLVMGDTHVDYADPQVIAATFGAGGIVERTRPQHLVWHDLLDGHTCNPHHDDDPFADIAKYYAGRSVVSEETDRAVAFVDQYTRESIALTGDDVLSVIVPSNHVDFLKRWIKKKDWKKLPAENKIFYLKTALHMAENTRLNPERGIEYPDPFTEIFRKANVPNSIALDTGASFTLGDVELGMHGDKGPNGTRGSIKNLRRIGVKSIIGHSHSPGEDEGCVQVGTSTRLILEYNGDSPSSWLNAHCDLNADGKRQLRIIIEGRSCL